MPLTLYMQNAFPPSHDMNMIPIDKQAKAALQAIIQIHVLIRMLNDEYEIALLRQRIADLKAEREAYVEHCWLHNRWRRS